MDYICLIYNDNALMPKTDADRQKMFMEYMQFSQDVHAGGVFVAGNPLQPPDNATTVRVRKGEQLVTDGPFTETKEWLGGYYHLKCANLDEALKWAAKIPGAKYGSIEVRPVMEINAPAAP